MPQAVDEHVTEPSTSDTVARLFDQHGAGLLRYLGRRVGPASAEDLVSDTFAAALERLPSFDPARGSERAWLYVIATNLLRHHFRSESRRDAATTRAAGLGHGHAIFDDGAADRVDAHRRLRQLAQGIADLADEERDVLQRSTPSTTRRRRRSPEFADASLPSRAQSHVHDDDVAGAMPSSPARPSSPSEWVGPPPRAAYSTSRPPRPSIRATRTRSTSTRVRPCSAQAHRHPTGVQRSTGPPRRARRSAMLCCSTTPAGGPPHKPYVPQSQCTDDGTQPAVAEYWQSSKTGTPYFVFAGRLPVDAVSVTFTNPVSGARFDAPVNNGYYVIFVAYLVGDNGIKLTRADGSTAVVQKPWVQPTSR